MSKRRLHAGDRPLTAALGRLGLVAAWSTMLGLLSSGAIGCGSSGQATGGCIAGDQQSCSCPDGSASVHRCSASGTWEDCTCGGDAGGDSATSDPYFEPQSGEGDEAAQTGGGESIVDVGCMTPPTAPCKQGGYGFGDTVYRNKQPTGRVHAGLDVHAPAGTSVYAVWDGQVLVASQHSTWGFLVEIDHVAPDGTHFVSLYGHLSPDLKVQVGDSVVAGAAIGVTGNSTVNGGWPPHLHFALFTGQMPTSMVLEGHVLPAELTTGYQDPSAWMKSHGSGAACKTSPPCTPVGSTQSCTGACGTGTQTCTGSGWGTCSSSSGACTPGQTQACSGGCGSGTQTCSASCSWGTCSCTCIPGTASCTPANPCHTGTNLCPSGCNDTGTPVPNGTSCSAGSGSCQSGTCSICAPGTASCTPANPCHTGTNLCPSGCNDTGSPVPNGTSCSGGTCQSGTCTPACVYSSPSSTTNYSCVGGAGSMVLSLGGSIDSSGNITLSGSKSGGGAFGDGTYVLRVFDPTASPNQKCQAFNSAPGGLGSAATRVLAGGASNPTVLTFGSFPSLLQCNVSGSNLKGYCLTKDADPSHVAWFCSNEWDAQYK